MSTQHYSAPPPPHYAGSNQSMGQPATCRPGAGRETTASYVPSGPDQNQARETSDATSPLAGAKYDNEQGMQQQIPDWEFERGHNDSQIKEARFNPAKNMHQMTLEDKANVSTRGTVELQNPLAHSRFVDQEKVEKGATNAAKNIHTLTMKEKAAIMGEAGTMSPKQEAKHAHRQERHERHQEHRAEREGKKAARDEDPVPGAQKGGNRGTLAQTTLGTAADTGLASSTGGIRAGQDRRISQSSVSQVSDGTDSSHRQSMSGLNMGGPPSPTQRQMLGGGPAGTVGGGMGGMNANRGQNMGGGGGGQQPMSANVRQSFGPGTGGGAPVSGGIADAGFGATTGMDTTQLQGVGDMGTQNRFLNNTTGGTRAGANEHDDILKGRMGTRTMNIEDNLSQSTYPHQDQNQSELDFDSGSMGNQGGSQLGGSQLGGSQLGSSLERSGSLEQRRGGIDEGMAYSMRGLSTDENLGHTLSQSQGQGRMRSGTGTTGMGSEYSQGYQHGVSVGEKAKQHGEERRKREGSSSSQHLDEGWRNIQGHIEQLRSEFNDWLDQLAHSKTDEVSSLPPTGLFQPREAHTPGETTARPPVGMFKPYEGPTGTAGGFY